MLPVDKFEHKISSYEEYAYSRSYKDKISHIDSNILQAVTSRVADSDPCSNCKQGGEGVCQNEFQARHFHNTGGEYYLNSDSY